MSDQTIEIEDDAPEVEILPEGGEGGAEATEAPRKEEPAGEVDGVDRLKANLDAEKRRADEAERRAKQAEEQRRQDAQKHQASSVDSQLAQFKAERQSSQRSIEALSDKYANAIASGNYNEAAKLNQQIAWHTTRMGNLDGGIYQLEEAKKAPQEQPPPEQRHEQQPLDRTEAFIQANGLAPKVASFIRENPGFVGTPRSIRRLADAHEDALAEGHGDQTEGYFEFVRNAMGAKRAATASAEMPVAPQRRPQMAAPPSRSSTDVGAPRRKLTLTAEQARTASEIGINMKDPKQVASYARELDRLRREGAR